MAKISVVLPVYNGEQYLTESIKSVVNQTITDWELIIVDDASTDKTPVICAEFANNDHRIRVITNSENKKLPVALNIGFRQATGDYCTWTSDDNVFAQEALKIMSDALDENICIGMVFCDQNYIDDTGKVIGNNEARNKNDAAKKLYLRDCIGGCFMYRRDVIKTIGEYDPDMFLVEDYDYWIRLSTVYEIKHLPIKLYFYRTHKDTLTTTRRKDVSKQLLRLKLKHFDLEYSKLTKEELTFVYACITLANKDAARIIKEKLYAYGIYETLNVSWLDKKREKDINKKYIVFGAGIYGAMALAKLGKEKVAFFSDNFRTGYYADTGIKILPFEKLKSIYENYNLLIAANETNAVEIAMKFEVNGINKYLFSLEEFDGQEVFL